MASNLHFIVVLCLTIGLWTGASAQCGDCCEPCKTCPPGWTQFKDHCYIYHHAQKKWADAELDCLDQGGNLASIPRQDVHVFVKKLIHTSTNKHGQTWVGGHDLAKEGKWMWANGEKLAPWKLWGPRQPDDAGKNEDCMELNFNGSPNDAPCNKENPFVCAKRL